MANCGTCRFWGADVTDAIRRSRYFNEVRPCSAIRQNDAYLYSVDRDREPPLAGPKAGLSDKAEVVDGSGFFAALRTAADFGCVLHETAP